MAVSVELNLDPGPYPDQRCWQAVASGVVEPAVTDPVDLSVLFAHLAEVTVERVEGGPPYWSGCAPQLVNVDAV